MHPRLRRNGLRLQPGTGASVPTLLALVLLGCGNSSSKGDTGSSQRTADAGPKTTTDAAPPSMKEASVAPSCHGHGYAGSPTPQAFTHLSATVVDGSGQPVGDLIAQACGTDICLN